MYIVTQAQSDGATGLLINGFVLMIIATYDLTRLLFKMCLQNWNDLD